MVMLHAFANYLPRADFFVVTVNHNIRKEGASDCRFVADYCKKLGVECQIYNIDVPAHAEQNKLSLETSARLLRYQIFDNLNCDFVCTAHHQRDNAETVLMHIIRGSGLVGAQGIKQYNGRYFRPLLQWSKQRIDDYARQNDVPFVIDQTNADDSYLRNYIRNKVLPLLRDVCPTVEQNIAKFAQNVTADEQFLSSLADISTVQFDGDSAKIPLQLFDNPQPIVYRTLKKVFEELGVFYDIERCHYQAICDVAHNVGGKQTYLPFGYVAINDYDHVTLCKNVPTDAFTWQIPFAKGITQTPFGKVLVTSEVQQDALRFDIDKIPATAVFRARQSGDTFTKFGGGTKPLKEYLIDKKISQRERDKLIILADGHNVLVVVGIEIADSVKTSEQTHTYYIQKI